MPTTGADKMFRLYSGAAGGHFYTPTEAERDNAVASFSYQYESIAGYVWTAPEAEGCRNLSRVGATVVNTGPADGTNR